MDGTRIDMNLSRTLDDSPQLGVLTAFCISTAASPWPTAWRRDKHTSWRCTKLKTTDTSWKKCHSDNIYIYIIYYIIYYILYIVYYILYIVYYILYIIYYILYIIYRLYIYILYYIILYYIILYYIILYIHVYVKTQNSWLGLKTVLCSLAPRVCW